MRSRGAIDSRRPATPRRLALALAALAVVLACRATTTATPKATPEDGAVGSVQRGKAAWYGKKFHGRKTASGERFDRNALTAAHRRLPFGTRVRVTNLKNDRSVVVRINDRGPWGKGRIIDVSEAAAKKLAMIRAGVVPVVVTVLERPPRRRKR